MGWKCVVPGELWTKGRMSVERRLPWNDRPWWVTETLGKGKHTTIIFLSAADGRSRTFKTAEAAMRAVDRAFSRVTNVGVGDPPKG